ncbi:hypothetical protein [Candidatus Xianfuyuplasma coldseepsis]|uniref:Uncharacterized protein n=1 Tax=Candidatus Xianfuyuplasma coldseepsis TaxID=2782163 RepID=A0A7L7KSQ2_9MOLU|nr:hypothetical protein [Xianfuyuplasma coldseepsis]QMS85737.1 hypothetical protein G4Z02_08265 [Xianfuyuplasma coldseepsis]
MNKFIRKHFLTTILFTLLMFYIVNMSIQVYRGYQFGEIGDNVSVDYRPPVLNPMIVEGLSDEFIVAFDVTKDVAFFFDKEGILIDVFRLDSAGSVELVDYNDDTHELTVYYNRRQIFYVIDSSGTVIDLYDGIRPRNLPQKTTCTVLNDKEYCMNHYFFFIRLTVEKESATSIFSSWTYVIIGTVLFVIAGIIDRNSSELFTEDNSEKYEST